ncbi:AAA family ATPase [Curtobacterium sp. PhB137]|uniref:AAA family ATPase n=1 Tax=Curtobacterium sp. PhB137 TaxID=2485182 RepID=UPI001608DD54|nr:AAA family ATPase [Curtobacterium sp. PhB137]
MKLLVIGPLASGKTTIARHLRSTTSTIVDLDDELTRLNGGVYPDIATRKTVIAPRALAAAAALSDVVLLHSTFDPDDVRALRDAGFTTVLLEVSSEELRRRHRQRQREEGWSNEEWAEDNRAQIAELGRLALFDHVIDAERAPVVVANDLLALTTP